MNDTVHRFFTDLCHVLDDALDRIPHRHHSGRVPFVREWWFAEGRVHLHVWRNNNGAEVMLVVDGQVFQKTELIAVPPDAAMHPASLTFLDRFLEGVEKSIRGILEKLNS